MNEQLEAERFSRELDSLLAGRPHTASGDDMAKDLQWAGKLSRLDLSAESAVKKSLKAELLTRPSEARPWRALAWLEAKPWRMAALVSVVAAMVIPAVTFWVSQTRQEGMIFHSLNLTPPAFNRDILTPLNVRDPGAGLFGSSAMSLSGASVQSFSMKAPQRPSLEYGEAPPDAGPDREGYSRINENDFRAALDHPLSTFSIDVDAASYANVRRFLNQGTLPPKDAVRIEELINYFRYDYPEPSGEDPFSITAEAGECPWRPAHRLVRIGLKSRSIDAAALPPNNLVFLIDSSGSMQSEDKLPLLKRAFGLLVEQLREVDRVSIVAYAGAAGLVLPPTSGALKKDILAALDRLEAGGSTAGGAGIALAYQVASENLLPKGNNRVILATDGDFNVGLSSEGELTRLIEEKRHLGVFLSVLGFGTGNVQDSKMEQLADKGNGNYAYVDTLSEARKVFVQELGATLLTVAKDVKLQVEFNPAKVKAYRLIGYENRALKAEDFNDDKKDAGELGAGHNVTALYEIVPAGVDADVPSVDPLKYQAKPKPTSSGELLTVKFRYKKPDADVSRLITRTLDDKTLAWDKMPGDFKFAASVAGFGMLLHGSKHAGDLDYAEVERLAKPGLGRDKDGYRAEFLTLVGQARRASSGNRP